MKYVIMLIVVIILIIYDIIATVVMFMWHFNINYFFDLIKEIIKKAIAGEGSNI